jgi:DNA recombination protein RmuC
MEFYLLIATCLLLVLAIILIIAFRSRGGTELPGLLNKMNELQSSLSKIESGLKEDFRINREENSNIAKNNRDELNNTLKDFKSELSSTLKNITDQNQSALREINNTLADKMDLLIKKIDENNKVNRETLSSSLQDFTREQKNDNNQMRESMVNSFRDFQLAFDKNVKSFNDLQREKFGDLEKKQNDLVMSTEKRLDLMRETVDEKLQKTLNERLGQSFETVGKQLQEVQTGLGEMKNLAHDVGDLKKVLSNVKQRGGMGEIQLEMLLEQILAPDQFEARVKTKAGSDDQVEFAIKLPGRDENQKTVYLPIDAKFPKDVYEHLVDAYDSGDQKRIANENKQLDNVIRKMAKDIRDKYIDPPSTTDFAIMFLPFEGIYAEVVRRSSLLEQLQREFKVIVTGPTTLAAILNSLQMGFRTLALQRRSSEVWEILGAVKTEFEEFGSLLDKAHKHISNAGETIEKLQGTRTRAIRRKLREVQALPQGDSVRILPEISSEEIIDEEEQE